MTDIFHLTEDDLNKIKEIEKLIQIKNSETEGIETERGKVQLCKQLLDNYTFVDLGKFCLNSKTMAEFLNDYNHGYKRELFLGCLECMMSSCCSLFLSKERDYLRNNFSFSLWLTVFDFFVFTERTTTILTFSMFCMDNTLSLVPEVLPCENEIKDMRELMYPKGL